jgi:hypothetical protein
MLAFALQGKLQPVDTRSYRFDQITAAWEHQAGSPNAKIILRP